MTFICLGLLLVLAAPEPMSAPADVDIRVARDDACRRLAGALANLRIDKKRTLAELIDPDADPLDALLPVARRAREVGKPINYSDKTLELHVALQPADVRAEVRALLLQRNAPPVVIRTVLDALSDITLADCTVAAGFASPQESNATEQGGGRKIETVLADMTTTAAILDARRQLVDRIGQLRVTGHKRLEDLMVQSPGLEEELVKSIPISVFGPTRRKSDGTTQVAATLASRHGVDLIVECMARLNPAAAAPKIELEGGEGDAISVRGIGVRPGHATLARMGLSIPKPGERDGGAPAWASWCLVAEGEAAVSGGDGRTAAAVASARDDAEFAARRRLAEQIDELKLPDGRTARAAILSRRIATPDLTRFLDGAHRFGMADALPDGRVRVRVRLPLAGLWRLIAAAEKPAPVGAGGGT